MFLRSLKIIAHTVAAILCLLGFAFLAFAAPIVNYTRTQIPETDSLFDIGTSTQAYREGWFDELCLTGDTCYTTLPSGTVGGTGTQGQLSYWTSNTNLGSVATTTLTASSPLSLSQPISVVGATPSVLTISTAGDWTGTLDGQEGTYYLDLANHTGTLAVANGGTGAATFTDNRLLTGNGTSAISDEANLTFDSSTNLLLVSGNASTTQLTTTGNAYLATAGGSVGVGTTTSLQAALNLNKAAGSGREQLIKATVDELSRFDVFNVTTTAGVFAPGFSGYQVDSSSLGALYFYGQTDTTNDTGTEPLILYTGRIESTGDPINGTFTAVTTRPIAGWENTGTRLMTLDVNGKLGLGDATPDQILEISGTNTQLLSEESTTEFFRAGVGETASEAVIGWDDSDSLQLGVYSSPTDTTIDPLISVLSTGATSVVGEVSAPSFDVSQFGNYQQANVNALYASSTNLSIVIGNGGQNLRSVAALTRNISIGFGAMNSASLAAGAINNTAIGDGTLASLTTGDNNTVVGRNAGNAITTGNTNMFLGASAGSFNQTGIRNVAIGSSALTGTGLYTASDQNVAVGYEACADIEDSSDNNICLGFRTADNFTSGSKNIIIGSDVDFPATTGSNQLNIGNIIFGTSVTGTGTTIAGAIGIATTTPSAQLAVNPIAGAASNAFVVGSSTATHLIIKNTGRVGVGTTSPSSLLELFSTASTTLSVDSNSATQGGCIGIKDKSGTGYTYVSAEDGVLIVSTVSCK